MAMKLKESQTIWEVEKAEVTRQSELTRASEISALKQVTLVISTAFFIAVKVSFAFSFIYVHWELCLDESIQR